MVLIFDIKQQLNLGFLDYLNQEKGNSGCIFINGLTYICFFETGCLSSGRLKSGPPGFQGFLTKTEVKGRSCKHECAEKIKTGLLAFLAINKQPSSNQPKTTSFILVFHQRKVLRGTNLLQKFPIESMSQQ